MAKLISTIEQRASAALLFWARHWTPPGWGPSPRLHRAGGSCSAPGVEHPRGLAGRRGLRV